MSLRHTWILIAALAAGCNDDRDADGFARDVDCNDDDPEVHPGAHERLGDGVDNDCDTGTPDGCVPDVPCVDGVCTLDIDIVTVEVGGTVSYDGVPLAEYPGQSGEVRLFREDGSEVKAPVNSGVWSADVPVGEWNVEFTLGRGIEVARETYLPFLLAEDTRVESSSVLNLDAVPVEISGRVFYDDALLPAEAEGLVWTGKGLVQVRMPVSEDARYSAWVPPGRHLLTFGATAPDWPNDMSKEVGWVDAAEDTVTDIRLQTAIVRGNVDVGGLPAGASLFVGFYDPTQVLRRGRSVAVEAGRYEATVYEGEYRIDLHLGSTFEGAIKYVSPGIIVDGDQRMDIAATLSPVSLVPTWTADEERSMRFVLFGPDGFVEGHTGDDGDPIMVFDGTYRVTAQGMPGVVDRLAALVADELVVDGPVRLEVPLSTVTVEGALTLDAVASRALENTSESTILTFGNLDTHSTHEAWLQVVDGRYRLDVHPGRFRIGVASSDSPQGFVYMSTPIEEDTTLDLHLVGSVLAGKRALNGGPFPPSQAFYTLRFTRPIDQRVVDRHLRQTTSIGLPPGDDYAVDVLAGANHQVQFQSHDGAILLTLAECFTP